MASLSSGFEDRDLSASGDECIKLKSLILDLISGIHSEKFCNGFSGNDHSNEHQTKYLASWVRDRMYEALKSLPETHPQDAAVLIKTASEYDDNMFKVL